MGLTCSITPNSDPPLHTLDGLVAHLCTFSESRAPGPESTHAWQRTIRYITGRSVGGENAHDNFDCAALVSSFLGLLVLALPSRVGRQSHLLCLRSVLRSTHIHLLLPHPSPSSRASRAPDRLLHLPRQHPNHERLLAPLSHSPSQLHNDQQRDERKDIIHELQPRPAHTTRQPLPLLRTNPPTHVARVGTRLRPPLSQTGHFFPPVATGVATGIVEILPYARVAIA